MTLRMGVVVPHGGELMPTLNSGHKSVDASLQALARLRDEIRASGARTLVVATPHGIRVRGHLSVSCAARAIGTLEGDLGSSERLDLPVAGHVAEALVEALQGAGIPCSPFSMGASSGPASLVPLDWGAFIPLWHLAPEDAEVVVLCPARELGFARLAEVGRILAKLDGPDTVFIASSDLSHSHQEQGPYGYDSAAAELDAALLKAMEQPGLLSFIRSLDASFIERAKPDGLWQISMMTGAQEALGWKAEVLSYDRPTYFGMMCARFA